MALTGHSFSWPHDWMTHSCKGDPFSLRGRDEIFSRTSKPDTTCMCTCERSVSNYRDVTGTCPNTTCFLSNQKHSLKQMKNWDELVSGPLLAMEIAPLLWRSPSPKKKKDIKRWWTSRKKETQHTSDLIWERLPKYAHSSRPIQMLHIPS